MIGLPLVQSGWRRAAGAAALAVCVVGCAATGGPSSPSSPSAKDPWEGFNRGVYAFNDTLDKAVAKPIAQGYDKVVPDIAKFHIRNFFSNIGDVFIGANNLLQGKPVDALSDLTRVVINTLFGFGGIADIASDLGLQKHNEDFGQTLGKWGVPSGPYLVLPVLGPSSVRDGIGVGVYYYTDPVSYLSNVDVRNSLTGLRLVDSRAQLLQAEKVVDGVALDRYTFLRDAYLQRRRSLVYDGNPPDDPSDAPPDYDKEDAGKPSVVPPAKK